MDFVFKTVRFTPIYVKVMRCVLCVKVEKSRSYSVGHRVRRIEENSRRHFSYFSVLELLAAAIRIRGRVVSNQSIKILVDHILYYCSLRARDSSKNSSAAVAARVALSVGKYHGLW